MPDAVAMDGVPQPENFHPEGDVWQHTLLMLDMMRNPTPTLAMGILLHDVGKPPTMRVEERIRFDNHVSVGAKMAKSIMLRYRFSKAEMNAVIDLVADHMHFLNIKKMRESKLKRFLRGDNFPELLELFRIDCLGSHGDLSLYDFCKEKLAEFGKEEIRPPRLINGYDLIELGMKEGPVFKEILDTVEDAQLENRLKSKEEAIEFVRSQYIKEKQ
jgi:poly(A) polymerase